MKIRKCTFNFFLKVSYRMPDVLGAMDKAVRVKTVKII